MIISIRMQIVIRNEAIKIYPMVNKKIKRMRMKVRVKVGLVHIDHRHFVRQEKNGNIVDNMVFNDGMDFLVQQKKIRRIQMGKMDQRLEEVR